MPEYLVKYKGKYDAFLDKELNKTTLVKELGGSFSTLLTFEMDADKIKFITKLFNF